MNTHLFRKTICATLVVSFCFFSMPTGTHAVLWSKVAELLKRGTTPAPAGGGTSVISGIGRPFGGPIIMMLPCLNAATYILLGPPSPGPYVYQVGLSRSYLSGPPSHPGQFLLGMAAPGGVCTQGFNVLYGSVIIYLGSSLFGPTFAPPSPPVRPNPPCC